MILSKKCEIKLNSEQAVILDSLIHAAGKLWNIANYEKRSWDGIDGLDQYPNWYDQKKRLKSEYWYKALPSQSAQEILAILERSWKSYFRLRKTGGVENPHPPKFATGRCLRVPFLRNNMKVLPDGVFRFTISKQQKAFLKESKGIRANYLILKIPYFSDLDHIKQISFRKTGERRYSVIAVYEVPDTPALPDNGHYLSIDMGVSNLMTCYDSDGSAFIISGSPYLNAQYYYGKEIAKAQSVLQKKDPKRYMSRKIRRLFERKNNTITDFLHKATRFVADYCHVSDINTVIIGDWTNIRKDCDFGKKTNQKFHALPFARMLSLLEYKLAAYGIVLVVTSEAWTSQCSPDSDAVSKDFAHPERRVHRGLYLNEGSAYNADGVGAYNILRRFLDGYLPSETPDFRCLSKIPKKINVTAQPRQRYWAVDRPDVFRQERHSKLGNSPFHGTRQLPSSSQNNNSVIIRSILPGERD